MTTQLDASVGLKKETTYGTGVTVDRHYEFTSETLNKTTEYFQGQGLRVGSRVPRASRRAVNKITVGGNITMDYFSRGMGPIFEAAFGAGTSTVISGAAYQQLFTVGTTADPLPSYTIQKGIPPVGGGTTLAHTFTGMVCNGFSLTFDLAGDLVLSCDWMGQDMVTATAYAAPTYPSATNGQIFTFVNGAVTVGGTVTAPTTTALASGGTSVAVVKSGSVAWTNNLDGGAFFLGGSGKVSRRPVVQYTPDSITGSLVVEFSDATFRDYYLNQTDLALVLTFAGSTAIVASNYPTIQVYIPNIRFDDGGVPFANGGAPVELTLPFHGLDNTTATSPIYVACVTADTVI